MMRIAPSLEILQRILSAPGIGFLIALICLIAFFLYLRPRPTSSARLPSESKSDTMASVAVPLPMEPKVFLPIDPRFSTLLDQFPEILEFPTLLPHSTFSTRTQEPIIREVHPRSYARVERAPGFPGLIDLQGSPIYLGSDFTSHSNTPDLIPGIGEHSNRSAPLPLQGAKSPDWLRWAVSDSTVFANSEEELRAARYPGNLIGREGLKNNMFFQWGLRYIPPPDADNVYRAVVIEELPLHVTLDQILLRIHGGQIYSASLFDTTPLTLTGSPTAMITFVNQDGALAFLRRVALEGFYVGFALARVRPVPTPTYLMSTSMEDFILRRGGTRCLVVKSRHPMIKKSLHSALAKSSFSTHVECFGERDGEAVVTVRFHSIGMAMRAYEFLSSQDIFKGKVKFETDPCSAV